MKVLALGGCGEMGRTAVKALLALCPDVEVTVADRNSEAARTFSETLSGRGGWLSLDIRDEAALDRAVKGSDLVLNLVGPYFVFGKTVLSSAIRTGVSYLDICDDWEPTLSMLELSGEAKKAGITAVIGMGASPGMTNLAGRAAIGELDEARSIVTGWDLESAKPEKIGKKASTATVHGFHQLTGTIRQFQNGGFQDVRPVRAKKIAYPGLSPALAWTIGHPESVTFPKFFPGLSESANVFTAGPVTVFGIKILAALADLGVISIERAAWLAERAEGPPKGISDWSSLRNEMIEKKRLPHLFALAGGMKNGKPESAGAMILSAPPGGMAGATGVPMAVGASLLLSGKIGRPGVFAPEGAFDPWEFFDVLAPLCSPAMRNAEDLLLITRSWENPDLRAILEKRL